MNFPDDLNHQEPTPRNLMPSPWMTWARKTWWCHLESMGIGAVRCGLLGRWVTGGCLEMDRILLWLCTNNVILAYLYLYRCSFLRCSCIIAIYHLHFPRLCGNLRFSGTSSSTRSWASQKISAKMLRSRLSMQQWSRNLLGERSNFLQLSDYWLIEMYIFKEKKYIYMYIHMNRLQQNDVIAMKFRMAYDGFHEITSVRYVDF